MYVSVCNFLSSTSIDDTVSKLESANFVTSAYRETAGLNILTVEKGSVIKIINIQGVSRL